MGYGALTQLQRVVTGRLMWLGNMCPMHTVHGKYLANPTGKTIGKENFGELATVSAYILNTLIFGVSVNIGEENFGE